MSPALPGLVTTICKLFVMLGNPSPMTLLIPWLVLLLALVWIIVILYFMACHRKISTSFRESRTGRHGSCVAWVDGSKVRSNYVSDYTGCQSDSEQELTSSWRPWPTSQGRRVNPIISLQNFMCINHSAVYVRRRRNC